MGTSPWFTLMLMALELPFFTLPFPTPTPLDPLQLNILPALLRSKLMLPSYMQATMDTVFPMVDGAMAMEFPSLLLHLPPPMPGTDTMDMAVDIMVDTMVDTTDILMVTATDTGAKFKINANSDLEKKSLSSIFQTPKPKAAN